MKLQTLLGIWLVILLALGSQAVLAVPSLGVPGMNIPDNFDSTGSFPPGAVHVDPDQLPPAENALPRAAVGDSSRLAGIIPLPVRGTSVLLPRSFVDMVHEAVEEKARQEQRETLPVLYAEVLVMLTQLGERVVELQLDTQATIAQDSGVARAVANVEKATQAREQLQGVLQEARQGYAQALTLEDTEAQARFRAVIVLLQQLDRQLQGMLEQLQAYITQKMAGQESGSGNNTPTDSDQDGVPNERDNCPTVANAGQQDSNSNGLGDACDSTPPPAGQLTPQQKYDQLENKFEEQEDEYSDLKRKYERAVKDDDEDDIKRYKKQLKDLRNEVRDLEQEVETLQGELSGNREQRRVLNLLGDLEEKAQKLRQSIKDTLDGKTAERESPTPPGTQTQQPARPRTEASTSQQQRVTVERLATLPPTATTEQSEVQQPGSWESVRAIAWISAGIVVMLAVIVFLLAALLI